MLTTLPKVYQVHCEKKHDNEFIRLMKIAVPKYPIDASGTYYKISNSTWSCQKEKWSHIPEVSFEDWQRLLESKKVLDHYQVAWNSLQGEEFLRLLTIACPGHTMMGGTKYYEICNRKTLANGGLIKNIPLLTIQEWREMLEGAAPISSSGKTPQYVTKENAFIGMKVYPAESWNMNINKPKLLPFVIIKEIHIPSLSITIIYNDGQILYHYMKDFYVYEESNNFSQIKQQQNEQHNNGYKANLFINYQSYGRTEKPRGSVLRLRTSPTFFSSKHLRNQACSL